MTYGAFLLWWLGLPLLALAALAAWDARAGRPPRGFSGRFEMLLLVHVAVALIYTTPWDNYLVATEVWGYPPGRVWGIRLGWVPLEEYLFFILQPILASLWLLAVARRLPQPPPAADWTLTARLAACLLPGLAWLASLLLLAAGLAPFRYLALILAWALPPVMLQLAFGADVLWRWRAQVLWAVLVPTAYLWLADTLAIRQGIWHISPAATTGLVFPGGLPIEEAVFFLATNVLVVFGMRLGLAPESRRRLALLRQALRARSQRRAAASPDLRRDMAGD